MLTGKMIEEVLNSLAEHIGEVNQAAEDGDRGASNDQLFLRVADDGSGSIGKVAPSHHFVDDWYWFTDHVDLVGKMRELGFEFDDPPAPPSPEAIAIGEARNENLCLRAEIERLRQTIEAMQRSEIPVKGP